MIRWSRGRHGLVLLLAAGCLDAEPTAPTGPAGFGTPELIPSRAWIETGGTLDFRIEPAGPFGLRTGGGLSAAGTTVTGVATGEGTVEAFFPAGKRSARITVVSPRPLAGASIVTEGLSDQSLLGVWSADQSTIFAVGGDGTAIVSRDAGATWRRMNTRVRATLTSVWGTSAANVYAVGASGTLIHYDGSSWEQTPLGTEQAILGVWGLDASHIYAVGAAVAFAFDGTRWQEMPGAAGAELWAVWGVGPDRLYASGQNGVILRWDGSTWRPMASPTSYVLFALWGLAADDVYAVGIRGTVLHFNGAGWSAVSVPSTADFFGLDGTARNNIIVVGNDGAVISFNGTAWTQAPQKVSAENLRAVHFDPTGRARIVGWAGTVIERGPQGWRKLLAAPILEGSTPGEDGSTYLAGLSGSLFRLQNAVLEPVGPVVRRDLFGITRTAGGDLVVVGDSGTVLTRRAGVWGAETILPKFLVRSVWADANDPDGVVAVGERGTILRRVGGRWLHQPSPTTAFLRHVFGLNSNDIFAVGDSGVILRFEGRAWVVMPTPVVDRLRSVWGSGPDDMFAVGEKGVALRYDGRSWYRIPTGIDDKELRAVFGLSPTEVYAVGESGLVLRFDGSRWWQVNSPTQAYLLGLSPGHNGTLNAAGTASTLLRLGI